MTMRIGAILLAAGAVAALGTAGPAAAQDIEVQAQARGITLPAGYYERVARDPDFFELKRGWRDRMPAGRSGVQGGISNGEEIIFRVAFKPTATILQAQRTVDLRGAGTELKARGRHDPCVVPRAVVMVEAMAALVLVDHWMRHVAQNGSFKF